MGQGNVVGKIGDEEEGEDDKGRAERSEVAPSRGGWGGRGGGRGKFVVLVRCCSCC